MSMSLTMGAGRVAGAYAAETGFEMRRILRMPAFAVPVLLLPLAFYYLLGVMMAPMRAQATGAMSVSDVVVFVSFAVYGVTGPGMFGLGSMLAGERQQGVLVLKRALPMPSGAYVVAKMLAALVFGIGIMLGLALMAMTMGGVEMPPERMLALVVVMALGVMPACAMGLFIAAVFPPAGAYMLSNIVFIAMVQLAGLFYPLPGALAGIRWIWPAYHLQQVGLWTAGAPIAGDPMGHAAVLVVTTLVLGVLGAWRLSKV
jgi:ABC-2 type transport system permease protein